MATDPIMSVCSRKGLHDHICEGRITWEHALIYAGRRVNGRPFIIPLCAKAHSVDEFQDGGDMNKEINVWVALNRATEHELTRISKAVNYMQQRAFLNAKYGVWVQPVLPKSSEINY